MMLSKVFLAAGAAVLVAAAARWIAVDGANVVAHPSFMDPS